MKILKLLLLFLFISLTLGSVSAQSESKYNTATIYYNEACGMCSSYIKNELIPLLEDLQIENIVKKDYVNEKQNRIELNELNELYDIPPTLQGHFMVFIDDKIVLGGHVPKHIIFDLINGDLDFEKILILQDEMGEADYYYAWGFKGEAKEYSINTPIRTYVDRFNENKGSLKNVYSSKWDFKKMMPLIVSTGFLDGINPCAFAVLLFFIAFLYTIHKTKANIWKMGIVYIFAIFLAYFLIGLGLIKAFIITGIPHVMAKIGAFLLIGLGILNLFNYLFPKSGLKIGIPSFSKEYLKKWMYRATIPSAFVLGFLVGLCTFPCSGGMYVAVVGLLAAKTTYAQGMVYLIIYNIMFVMPLVIMLIIASNKRAAEKLSEWETSQSKKIRLISGIVMILLGLIILLWFV